MNRKIISLSLCTTMLSFASINHAWSSASYDVGKKELVIDAVDVGNQVYKARLITTDLKKFTLTAAEPVADPYGENAVYDTSSLLVTLPSVSTYLSGKYGAPSYYQVKLRYVPNSNPMQFTLDYLNPYTRLSTASRSSSIALTSDNRFLVIANRESNSVSIFQVKNTMGQDTQTKLAEVKVDTEPRYVAISPDDQYAYVSNAVTGTVSVVSLQGEHSQLAYTIPVGSEPRGLAFTPNGNYVYVANHTSKSISQIDTQTKKVINTIQVQGNPMAVAVTNDGDAIDNDETVYVTDFFSRTIEGKRDGFDDAKQGIVYYFNVGEKTARSSAISPLANSGFAADRSNFCAATAAAGENLQSEIFCPDTTVGADNTAVIQGVYPNQFYSTLLRQGKLYLPNVGAAPEPPIKFNVNVQALVNVLDTTTNAEIINEAVNLNNQIKTEVQPENTAGSLTRVFGNELVAIDGDRDGNNFLIVSRGGNYVIHAQKGEQGLTINAPDVTRYQTGNIPSGVVMAHDGTRAYTNNEVGFSFSVLDLENKIVMHRDIASSTPPAPGTDLHRQLVGKLTFFTALGTPNNGIFDTQIRDIVPVEHRNTASDNGWSSCGSCHNDGLADGVTWFFPTGPRQTIPLDGFFAKGNSSDQRISNWNAVRGSITDFNNNSRNIQGGEGFADDPTLVFNHGPVQGVSDALDAMTEWVQIVRSPVMPEPTNLVAFSNGATVFESQCAACHGGEKWTKSQIVFDNDPTFDSNPLAGGTILDNRVANAGPQIISMTDNGKTLQFLEDVNSFNAADEFEIRGAGGGIGIGALGGIGFNVPSLLGVGYHGFYFHDGSATTLEQVFAKHTLNGKTITETLTEAQRKDLEIYLNAIDDDTSTFASDTDFFLQ